MKHNNVIQNKFYDFEIIKRHFIMNTAQQSLIFNSPFLIGQNPAQDMLNIEFKNPTGEEISGVLKVFDLSGQLIFEKQLNTNNAFYMLDISSLTNGAYIFSIQINNNENTSYRNQSGKLIVLKP